VLDVYQLEPSPHESLALLERPVLRWQLLDSEQAAFHLVRSVFQIVEEERPRVLSLLQSFFKLCVVTQER